MRHGVLCVTCLGLIWSVGTLDAFAEHPMYAPSRSQPPGMPAGGAMPMNRTVVYAPIQQVSGYYADGGMMSGPYCPMAMPAPQRYPQMHAPLYPSPIPNVPVQVGGTTISNQALAPHEMMYPHEYKAMFPPFYYKVSGGWLKTPWGMESHDKWVLQGTEVKVKYKDRISLFSGFRPPVLR